MRLALSALALCALLAGTAAANDFETLQGTWKLVLAVRDGKPLTGAELDARVAFEGDRFSVQGPSVWPLPSGTFKLNDASAPKTIDLSGEDGDQGKTAQGLYEIRAGNRVRFCLAPAGAARPAKFESRAGSGLMLQEWERTK